ncbi:Ctf1 zinc-finger transcription factor [Candida orthopsilosis Co 90-125]|uniref:Ctf1 zinc-finger transcription factor n=1 Tax=Candida orthopsilosis (strain 90-125) TaxID=1136231 RepID=H8WYM0_CANO9|nr:Ctf1 zinc-finger transcription factor [Candida orthopsilosis Co 90-125]CCG21335.1 Ctf1 zinc-finger transcription factor [Candida orthopsilosis Co 90-125]
MSSSSANNTPVTVKQELDNGQNLNNNQQQHQHQHQHDNGATTTTDDNYSTNKSNPKDKPKAFTIKYKRPRGSRACTVCRSRKVRCDAEIHIPCTNCITFGCDCVLPEVKKRGNKAGESKPKKQKLAQSAAASTGSSNQEEPKTKAKSKKANAKEPTSTQTPGIATSAAQGLSLASGNTSQSTVIKQEEAISPTSTHATLQNDQLDNHQASTINHISSVHHTSFSKTKTTKEPVLNISQISVPPSLTSTYKNRPSMHKKELLTSRGKPSLTYVGSSSIAVYPHKLGENHVQLAEDVFDLPDSSLDAVEMEILKLRGAFLLPSKELTLGLIESYFEHVHPLMPVLNRTLFMQKFNDPNDSPSLMVLHAVLLCGSRVSKNPLILDSNGSTNLASITFFKRAKALYEMNYESDPLSIIQTLILIGSYWDGPEDVTKNSFYWTRVAGALAQGFGFQRDVTKLSSLSLSEKRLWRRIWWCLFEKDRNVAIAFGRPVTIDLNDCDVPMLTMEDFDENDPELGIVSPYKVNDTHALYFIHLIKLAEITGIIIKHQYSIRSESMKRRNAFSIIEHCDMLMGIWFTNLPPQLVFSLGDPSSQNFYACLLNAQYYNRLFLIHRSNLMRMAKSSSTNPNNYKYPSWGISFQSARMISIISKILMDRDQLKYVPTMYVYIAFSALIMLIYHIDSTNTVIASTASESLLVSRAVVQKLGEYYPVVTVLIKLFDKYANDKIKRASVIESGMMINELNEKRANESGSMEYGNQHQSQQSRQRQSQSQSQSPQSQARQSQQQPLPPPPSQPLQHPKPIQHPQVPFQQQQPQQQSPIASKFSPASVASGVSLGETGYHDYQTQQSQARAPISQQRSSLNPQQQQQNRNTNAPPTSQTPVIEQLIQQYKVPMKQANGADGSDKAASETSPDSSTRSFPDISLVTENIPNKQNFFENFDPTQLFPTFSTAPSAVHSPSNDEDMGSNIYDLGGSKEASIERQQPQQQQQQEQGEGNSASNGDNATASAGGSADSSMPPPSSLSGNFTDGAQQQQQQAQQQQQQQQQAPPPHPPTPGFQTNFMDSSFINMNLQSGFDPNDEINALFNFIP